ncbi:excinuclease ABC subunit UvrA [Egibacter rhizosphaerae]|uniref:UvrABC system protein A n=1 Tax=Egibacter rhizosphaerae TaxID=1670831 RepID=A0A411YLS0_9ACTN|nr:excinuclease ABC subunit UvrA [Egibacter rhizosphaerae]
MSPRTATPAPATGGRDVLAVRGAREHNLADIDVDIPRDRLVVITGLSGSGKSSLAFDTIYAEGQRRYVESLSAYARQFLGQMEKPDVESIEGLSPAISIDQKSTSRNPRSTVGTTTEIYDYLRLLYARVGQPHCPRCGQEIAKQTPEQIVDQVEGYPEGTRFQILAPVVRGRKGEYDTLMRELAGRGFARARITSGTREPQIVDLAGELPRLERYEQHTIEVIVDRLVAKDGIRRRLADSIETALELGDGLAAVETVPRNEEGEAERTTFSEHLACTTCQLSFDQLAPRDFSFNTYYGACETCGGLGTRLEVDPDLIIGDPALGLDEGVILPWATGSTSTYYRQLLRALAAHIGVDPATPWRNLPKDAKRVVLRGLPDDERILVQYTNRFGRRRQYRARYEGVLAQLVRRHAESESEHTRERIEQYMRQVPCSACKGARLKPLALAVTVGGNSIAEACALSVADADAFFSGLELSERDAMIAEGVLKEVSSRLGFLLAVGLDYLTLDRSAGTLAGGEAQRIRLATQIGSGLVGCLYVLDEPSIGLHQRDNERLIDTLARLRDLGNTVIVVEHDEATIRSADHVVDIGPGAGEHGGRILHSGPVEELTGVEESLTGDYLAGRREIPIAGERRKPRRGHALTIRGAKEHNLQNLDARFPLSVFTCVTGVSGSGKSTLVNDILRTALMREVNGSREVAGKHRRMEGLDGIDKVVGIDQSPIGRTPRSNPATYTGLFDHIRKLFASTQEAKVRGYQPGRFSFNVKGGRCEACSGDGTILIDMQFLPDIHVPCEVCKGARYNRETLEVRYKGKTIAEVLDMSIEEARDFFSSIPAITRHLETLVDVGLGYVRLGQPATTLSGGEAQRVKLASELRKRATGQTVYILDEPTTGLHFEDVRKLLSVLHRLVDKGNTVIVIEHDLDVIKTADWVIDLGPEGGAGGGRLVAQGSPEQVAAVGESYTGKFLAGLLQPAAG